MIWEIIIAISTAAAAFAALITAKTARHEMHQAAEIARSTSEQAMRLTKFSAELESIRHLDMLWYSDRMVKSRRSAAKALLRGEANSSVDQVMDFFQEIVRLTTHDALPLQTAYDTYYWPMANYLQAADFYIKEVMKDEGATWDDISSLLRPMKELESRRIGTPMENVSPSISQTKEFLKDESKLTI